MPLDPAEAIALSDEAVALGQAIRDAFDPDGPHGKKVTKAEAKAIRNAALELAWQLTRDILD